MKYKIVFPALVLSIGMLTGCGTARPSKFYQLTVPGESTTGENPPPYPVTLLLGPITTSNLYPDDHIVYTSRGEGMSTYEYHRWAEPPSEMIREVLLRELQVSSRYQHVYYSPVTFAATISSVDACTISRRSTQKYWRPAWHSISNSTTRQVAPFGADTTRMTNPWAERM